MFEKELPKGFLISNCTQCGNKTKLDILKWHKEEYRDEYCSDTYWIILKCAACDSILFAKNYWDQTMYYNDEYTGDSVDFDEFSVLYPVRSYNGNNVPEQIHNSFEIAIKAQHLDGSVCLLTLRRTLELVCKEQGEIKGSLVRKIENLANRGILPPILKEATYILRKMGNEAAHGDEFNYSSTVVKEMINFTQIIIEYVYVLPYRIGQMKNKKNILDEYSDFPTNEECPEY